ncbi:hypothetical protein [Bariatricus sp. HCP28S3_D3]|uniref:hypothetical protein n=1 Tax=Bariatricus sp. HCP28S3_D3 TaxID=3438901 RepID=UPI003F8A917C
MNRQRKILIISRPSRTGSGSHEELGKLSGDICLCQLTAETIYRRLLDRQTESSEEIIDRLRTGPNEIKRRKYYDEVITNDKLELGVDHLYRAYQYICAGKSEADETMTITDDMMNIYDLDDCSTELRMIADRLDDKDSVKALFRGVEQFFQIRGWIKKPIDYAESCLHGVLSLYCGGHIRPAGSGIYHFRAAGMAGGR